MQEPFEPKEFYSLIGRIKVGDNLLIRYRPNDLTIQGVVTRICGKCKYICEYQNCRGEGVVINGGSEWCLSWSKIKEIRFLYTINKVGEV